MAGVILIKKTVKARKQHECSLCALPIDKWEKHEVIESIFDGEFRRHRYHHHCIEFTDGWTEHDWETSEPCEFRQEVLGIYNV